MGDSQGTGQTPSPLPTELFDSKQLVTNPVELITYEVDAGFDRGIPDGAFYPHDSSDVGRLVRWAHDQKVPLIARGAGTGLSGGVIPEHGGIVVVFSQMNRLLELDVRGRTAQVQSGAVNLVVDRLVKAAGLYYPPDPASGRSSVIGGNLGTNAGGPHCFKYGVTTNYIMGLTMVLADGEIATLGGQALDYPEYDLCALVVGSEGTLGIVTEAWLRLIANPPGVKTMMVSFESETEAGKAVSAVIAAGLMPATLELMDQRSMRMIEEFTHAGLPTDAGAALIVEVDGYPESLDSQMEEAADLLQANGGYDIRFAQTEEERAKIWYGRKSAAGAFSRLSPNYVLTDVTVPRSQLGEVLADITAVCDRYDVRTANFYHAGDGNLHPLILCDLSDTDLMKRVHAAGKEIIQICLDRDGSITGEHGVGMEKRSYMPIMYSNAELAAMLDIRSIFNPDNVFNPGKVFPEIRPEPERLAPVLPDLDTFAPSSAQEAASGLAALTGAGTKVRIGSGPLHEAEIRLSTENMQGIRSFAPDDLNVTVGAGMPLSDVQAFLADHNLQTPLVSPWLETTVGGLVASNINAPLRMRYGGLRDIMLCTTVAMAKGEVIRAGRPLVKNVAGYDLAKVFVGSHGTLGLLTDITLKLFPLPRARHTLAIPVSTVAQGLRLADHALAHALTASAVVLVQNADVPGLTATDYALLYTAEGLPEDVEAELTAVSNRMRQNGVPLIIETEYSGIDAWSGFLGSTQDEQLLIRAGVPAKTLSGYLSEGSAGLSTDNNQQICIDCASGLVYVKVLHADQASALAAVTAIRQPALSAGGYAIVMSMPQSLYGVIDRWGYKPSAGTLMSQLKDRWDPAHILNPGAFLFAAAQPIQPRHP